MHSLSGLNSGPKHSRGGAIGQSPTRGRTLADLPRWAPGRCHRCMKRSGLFNPLNLAGGGGARRGAGEAGWEWGHFSRDTLAGRARC